MIYKNITLFTKLHIFCLFWHGDFDMLLGKLYSRQKEAISQVGKCKTVCWEFCLMAVRTSLKHWSKYLTSTK